MKKTKLLATLLCTASMIVGSIAPSIPVMADAVKVVTLGADLTEDQKNTMLRYFNVDTNEVQILTITNQDERDRLSSYVPLEQIGTRTVSCAYVKPTTSGGIKVRTANLNWVTCNMIASTLSTSGVTNCEVIAACPFEVSGTGALTGILMAYESASGEALDETKKEIATEEMVVTGNLADEVGQDDATTVVNQAKMQVIADNVQNADEIYNIVVNTANNYGISISEEQIETIVNLLEEIAQQDYDYAEMQETLERVNDNVTGEAIEEEEYDPDSIVNSVDESVLGDDVIASSTEDPSLAQATGSDDFAESDEGWEEFPAEETDELPAEATDGGEDVYYEENGENGNTEDNVDVMESEDAGAAAYSGTDEVTDVSQLDTSFLGEEAKAYFEKAKTFCKGEYEGDAASLQEVMGADAYCQVTLDAELGKKLSLKVLETYLGILGNGTGSYVFTGNEKYMTVELNMLDQELKDIFGIDVIDDGGSSEDIDILGSLISYDDKYTLYEDTMKFFEELYGESYDNNDGSEDVLLDDDIDSAAIEEDDTLDTEEEYDY